MSRSNLTRSFALALSALAIAACSDRGVTKPTETPAPAEAEALFRDEALIGRGVTLAGSVVLTPGASATVEVGKTVQVSAKVYDRRGIEVKNAVFFWGALDTQVATISQSGLVSGLKPGTTIVGALYGAAYSTIELTVKAAATAPTTPTTPTPPPPTTPTTPPPTTPTTPPPTTPTTPPPTTPTTPPNGQWTYCAAGGTECFFTGLREVRLGPVGGPWVTKTAIRSVPCAPYGFEGRDPAPGRTVRCEYGPMITTTINNPMPGMSGLNPTVLTIPVGSAGATGPRSAASTSSPYRNDGSGSFRIICTLAKYDFMDPIVNPGQPNSSHLHMFFGNAAINPYSTPDQIANSGGSTCMGGTLNRSAYWIPAVFDSRNGEVQLPVDGIVYYKSGYRVEPSTIQSPPTGLRMIAGDKNATTGQSNVEWQCRDAGGIYTSIPTNCRVGDAVRLVIHFPQCWDGRNLDSPDHKSHMAFPNYRNAPQWSSCPSTHPIPLPQITEIFDFPVTATSNPATWRLSSDMYSMSTRGGFSAHADWMNGWDTTTMNRIVRECLNKGLDCGVGMTGGGISLTF